MRFFLPLLLPICLFGQEPLETLQDKIDETAIEIHRLELNQDIDPQKLSYLLGRYDALWEVYDLVKDY